MTTSGRGGVIEGDRDGGMGEGAPLQDSQRRVRRSPLLFTAPLVLLAVLILILLWEAVRANVSPGARGDWPWRLQLLDMEALGSLLAVAVAPSWRGLSTPVRSGPTSAGAVPGARGCSPRGNPPGGWGY